MFSLNPHRPREKKDNFILLKKLLQIGGISLQQNNSVPFKIYSTVIMCFNVFPFLQFIGVHRYLQKKNDLFEFIIYQVLALIVVAKVAVMIRNRITMGILIEKLQSGLLSSNKERGGEEEEILIKRYVRRSEKQIMVYWMLLFSTTILALTDSVLWKLEHRNDKTVPSWRYEYGPFTIFNTTYSPNYEIAFLYQDITWLAFGCMFVCSELLTVVILSHITCQLKILQNAIRRMVLNSYRRMIENQSVRQLIPKECDIDASKIPWHYLQPVVKETVLYHLAIIEIADQTERIFNILVLLILMSAVIIIAGFSYKFEGTHVGGIACQFCEISLICYWGNEVSLESQKVMNACYDVNFFGTDVRFQKSLFLIMERSKKPIVFSAAKFSPLTLGTFLTIARAAYSFMLILRRMA